MNTDLAIWMWVGLDVALWAKVAYDVYADYRSSTRF